MMREMREISVENYNHKSLTLITEIVDWSDYLCRVI
jgi:hypothetical protein